MPYEISVKKVAFGISSNTVKFKDAFENKKEVTDWHSGVQDKRNQLGQKIIAESSLGTLGMRGKELLYPIMAMDNLFKQQPLIQSVIKSNFSESKELANFKEAVKAAAKNFSAISQKTNIKDIPGISPTAIVGVSNFMKSNLLTRGAELTLTVGNLVLLCEKIIEKSSKEESATKYNFYQMFYDQVLLKKKIAYAVASRNGKTLKYDFYSLVNFAQEYKSWIELRTKNSANQLNDALGMDV